MKKRLGLWVFTAVFLLSACASPTSPTADPDHLVLPELAAVPLNGRPLRVVATTSLVADAVARVGGDAIQLTVLMQAGQDPHSYEPSARDFTAVAEADVLFVNGWGLEEGLLRSLASSAEAVPFVPISAGIVPLAIGEDEDGHGHGHGHGPADPHVWFKVANVQQWVQNAQTILSALDPAHAADYAHNAAVYHDELTTLIQELASRVAVIPPTQRKLVTNHDVFAYFAAEYDFKIIGTVIPGASTLAEPSASAMAALADTMAAEGVCTLFTENTSRGQLAQTVAAEAGDCATVQVIQLFTDALGPAGSGAENYPALMLTNMDLIVGGLK